MNDRTKFLPAYALRNGTYEIPWGDGVRTVVQASPPEDVIDVRDLAAFFRNQANALDGLIAKYVKTCRKGPPSTPSK